MKHKENLRCAAYIRVSTKKEEQKTSLENQLKIIKDFTKSRGWYITETYVDIMSGTKGNRPKLQEMLSDATQDKFDIIISKELSRIARNTELAHKIKRILEENKIDFLTLDNAIDNLSSTSNIFGLMAWLYSEESETISKRIKASKIVKAKSGEFNGTIPPYGYFLKDKKLFIRDDDTPKTIKKIFKEYVGGLGFDAIARKLFEEGLPSPSMLAKKSNQTNYWSGSGIRCILENRSYTGSLVQCKTTTLNAISSKRKITKKEDLIIIQDAHEALIDIEDFNLVQSLIAKRRKSRVTQTKHLFTAVLICDDCGRGLIYKKHRKGYICSRFNKLGSKACSNHHIYETIILDKLLLDAKQTILNYSSEDMESLSHKLESYKIKSLHKLDLLDKEKDKLNAKKIKMFELLLDDTITNQDYKLYIDKFSETTMLLDSQILSLNNLLKENLSSQIIKEFTAFEKTFTNLKVITPEILNRFVESIVVKEDKSLIIKYKFSFPNEELFKSL